MPSSQILVPTYNRMRLHSPQDHYIICHEDPRYLHLCLSYTLLR